MRFGCWDQLIAELQPEDIGLYCTTTATIHYGKGVAHAAKGQLAQAKAERAAFVAAYEAVPESRYLFNNTSRDILAIAAALLDGEMPCQHPGNLWSLHGYHECLQRLGRDAEAAIIGRQLELALARADVPVIASCACRLDPPH